MKNKNRAFSLIELSIVILIIGILIAGVTQGSRLVNASKIQTAQTLTQSSPVSSISGLLAWYETSNEASFTSASGNGTTITTDTASLSGSYWNDNNPQVTVGRLNLLGSTGTSYKLVGINGLPSASFAASGIGFASSSAPTSPYNAYTVFAVARTTNVTANNTIVYNGTIGSTNGFGVSLDTNRMTYVDINNAAVSATGTTAATLNAAQVLTVTIAPNSVSGVAVASPAVNSYVNGIADISTTKTAMALPTVALYVGNRTTTSSAPFIGDISEIIIFNTVLKTSDRRAVEKYLGQKYGIPVSQG